MERQISADLLVHDWLTQQFPDDSISLMPRTSTYEFDPDNPTFAIIFDGVTVGELKGTTLSLLHPSNDFCLLVDLTHPASLTMLSDYVHKHIKSSQWGLTIKNNRIAAHMSAGFQTVHRSSLGYHRVWTS